MRRGIVIGMIAILLCWIAPLVQLYSATVGSRDSTWRWFSGFDFDLRCHETECLTLGYDPFLVWKGTTPVSGYTAFDPIHGMVSAKARFLRGDRLLHVYPPWSMAMAIPLTWLPQATRYQLYTLFEIAVLAGLVLLIFRRAAAQLQRRDAALLVVALGGLAMVPIARCLNVGNYGILIAGSLVAALALLEKRRDVLAGLCFAVTMIKPQIGLLYFFGLLLLGRWRAILSGGAVLIGFTLLAAWLCGSSPLAMILSIREYNAAGYFPGTGLITADFGAWLGHHFGTSAALAVGIAAGVLAGAVTMWPLRKSGDIFFTFMPLIFISTIWAAGGWVHDHSIDCVGLMLLGLLAFRYRENRGVLIGAAVAFFTSISRELGVCSLPIPNWMLVIHIIALMAIGWSLPRPSTTAY